MRGIGAVVAGVAVVLAGCGDEGAAGGAQLRGKAFLSTQVSEAGKVKQLVPNTRVRLQFMDDGRLTADAGCNSMGGKVDTGGGTLAVEELAITEMECDAPRGAQDQWLAGVLQGKPKWVLDGETLRLTAGDTTLTLQDRETAQPDKPLDGTRWTVETLISGEVASTPGSATAYLTINGERVTGSTGCNDFQGVVARTGDKLTFGDLTSTQRACEGDAGRLENAVVAVLKGQVSYQIESDRLKLRTASGDGLDLTA